MNIRTAGLLVLAVTAASPQRAAADVAPMDCLAMASEARRVNAEVIEVTVHLAWSCDVEKLRQGYAKMSINGQSVGPALAFDGMNGIVAKARTSARLPMQVCMDVQGEGASTGSAIAIQECENLRFILVPLPQPRLGEAGEMRVVPKF